MEYDIVRLGKLERGITFLFKNIRSGWSFITTMVDVRFNPHLISVAYGPLHQRQHIDGTVTAQHA